MGQPAHLSGSSQDVLESALHDAITRLTRGPSSSERRALLVEARRLKSVLDTWHAIPPPVAARREMLSRVMQLAALSGSGDLRTTSESAPHAITTNGTSSTDVPVSRSVQPTVSTTRLMRHVAVSAGISVTRAEAIEWRPFPRAAGVSIKVLHRDQQSHRYTGLLYLAPGAELPRHRHATDEDLYVVEGSLDLGDVRVEAGDYCHAEAGSIHEVARSPEGCTLLVVGSEHDEQLESLEDAT
jgi:quercetin dioxygenase-like cupin family protein